MSKQRELLYKDGTPYPFADGAVDNGSKLNMAQQTAVDWLWDKIVLEGNTNYTDLLVVAKQMEKEQIMMAIKDSWYMAKGSNFQEPKEEKYYNEMYGE
jgi:hypothetical protein